LGRYAMQQGRPHGVVARHRPRENRYKAERSKSGTMLHEESEEAVVPSNTRRVQPGGGKGLCFNGACVRW